MTDFWRYVLVGVILLLTHMQEGITGFGCTVLSLPFVTLLLGLRQAVPLLVLQGWILVMLIVLAAPKKICWREYLRIVLLAGIGLPLGMWAGNHLPEACLRAILAVFMILVGLHGFIRMRRLSAARDGVGDCPLPNQSTASVSAQEKPLKKRGGARQDGLSPIRAPESIRWRWTQALLPLGGVFQGAFGTGGPLIVVYATQALREKTAFRATLCMLWVTLNTILVSGFVLNGRIDPMQLKLNAAYLPATLLGFWLGNHAHYRLNEALFRQFVYIVLALGGVALAISLALR